MEVVLGAYRGINPYIYCFRCPCFPDKNKSNNINERNRVTRETHRRTRGQGNQSNQGKQGNLKKGVFP
jgi:hypothetical protein